MCLLGLRKLEQERHVASDEVQTTVYLGQREHRIKLQVGADFDHDVNVAAFQLCKLLHEFSVVAMLLADVEMLTELEQVILGAL